MTVPLGVGDLVRLRGREWVVEALKPGGTKEELSTVELTCIADDAQGESLRAVIDSEIDVRLVQDDLWQQIGREGSDDPKVLAAHVRAVAWKSATAADRELFQAPFRAGICGAAARRYRAFGMSWLPQPPGRTRHERRGTARSGRGHVDRVDPERGFFAAAEPGQGRCPWARRTVAVEATIPSFRHEPGEAARRRWP